MMARNPNKSRCVVDDCRAWSIPDSDMCKQHDDMDQPWVCECQNPVVDGIGECLACRRPHPMAMRDAGVPTEARDHHYNSDAEAQAAATGQRLEPPDNWGL